MPVEIRVPPLGESVVEATVGRWTKKEGDTVGVNELLAVMEAGVGAPAAAEKGRAASARYEEKEGAAAPKETPASATATAEPPAGGAQTSPAARAIAAEHGIDLGSVRGSGPNGRVTKDDVVRAAEGKTAAPAQPAPSAPAAAASSPAPAPAQKPAASASANGRPETRERM